MDITQLLAFSVKNKASDLHLSAGLPPMIRVHGDVRGQHATQTREQRRQEWPAGAATGPLEVGRVEIDVDHLAGRVDPGIRASGDDQSGRLRQAQDPRQPLAQLALDGAQAGLDSPTVEVRAVVGEVETQPHAVSVSGATGGHMTKGAAPLVGSGALRR